MSSCVQEEFVTYDPEAGTVQTLGDIAGCTLDADGTPIETTFTEVDFGVSVPVVYTLNVAPSGKEITTKLTASIAEGKISIAQKDINAALLNMGAAADVEFAVDFQLVACLADIKGAAITDDESYVKYSNVVTAKFVPYSTTVLDVDKYDHIYIIGAAESIGGWNHSNVFQFLYNYNGDGNTYTGMIYYTDGAAGGWKLTGADNWDNGNWGSPDQAEAAEAAEITLLDDGGSKDIKCYSLPYYMWTFDKSTLKLKKEFGFTTMGIVGDFNGWDPAAENVVMTYNPYLHRFYIDWDFATDALLKFAADGAWDLNFGVDMAKGGDNIPVTAGKYRIYLDFNKNEYTFDANMYGKEEPGQPSGDQGGSTEPEEPVKALGWGLVGEYNSWGGEPDVMLTSDGTYYVVKGVALSGQVKFRKDNDWAVNFGAPGDIEPVEITVNTELELVAGGKNFTIADGTYDIYLDEANAKAWFITDGSYPGGAEAPVPAEWGLIGSLAACNNWSNNVVLYVSGDYSVAKGVQFAAGDQFKFRKGEAWGVELTYEGQITIDAKLDLIDGTGGKQNSSIAEGGSFDVYLANDLTAFYVMTPGKTPADAGAAQKVYTDPSAESFVVGFSGGAIGWDDPSFDANDRAAFVSKNVTDEKTFAGTYEFQLENFAVAAGDEFKVRINGQWIGVGGATVEGLKVSGSDNFVADEAGTYTATITFAWDGSSHSDVKVVFASEASALTVAGKQWAFNWSEYGMMVGLEYMSSCLDFGVSIEGYFMAGIDYEAIYGEEAAGMWVAGFEAYYEVEPIDETSGNIWLLQADWESGELTRQMAIEYYNLTETTCTFNNPSLMLTNVEATLMTENVTVYSQGVAM